MHLISIIIPVYNVAPFLKRCLDSVVYQTYQNIEILLIDDGSTDDSSKICDEYASKYETIKVIHKTNAGVSSARNLGIEISKGEYITFIDSDDTVQSDYVEVMYKNAIQYNTPISCCMLDVVEIDGTKRLLKQGRIGTYTKIEILNEYFDNQFIKDQMYGPYNKLIKKSSLRDIRFKPYKMGEDILFVFELLQECDKVYIDKYIGYHYLHREGSAMTSTFSTKRLDYIHAGEEMYKICCEKASFICPKVERWLFNHILVTLRQIYLNNMTNLFEDFYRTKKKYLFDNRRLFKSLSNMRKLDYIALFTCPYYFKLIQKLK